MANLDLFGPAEVPPDNLLPYDGEVCYYGPVMGLAEADGYFQAVLDEVAWAHDEVVMFGQPVVTKRKVAWYGDQPFSYTYSRATKTALPWTVALKALKEIAEAASGERYNACLLNLYHDGSEGMGWHSDAERDLKQHGAIGSMSLGAPRKFAFKHKVTKESVSTTLEHGSLLVMKGTTQTHWLHRLPPSKKVFGPRINLTFRMMAS